MGWLKLYDILGLKKSITPEKPGVCCASAQNRIKIHKSEFLYPANCIKEPDNRGFFAYLCKK
ncbi:MAG: hypothetical protein LBP71_04275, partial [Spirochaetaceae bacterium]|nr:hypothetical protein [Spirochaetaceae bacterium]